VVHALLGAYFGIKFESIWLVVVVGLLSHFVLDWIPHWDGGFDHKTFRKGYVARLNKGLVFLRTMDGLLMVLIVVLLYLRFDSGFVVIGAFAALFPDVVKIGYFIGLRNKKWYKSYLLFHSNVEHEVNPVLGLFTQVVAVGILLWLIL